MAEGHPLAPSNTTDFLMDDHDDQHDVDLLFDRYGQPTPRESPLAPGGWGSEPGAAQAGWPPLEPSVARLVAEHIQMESQIEVLEARIALVRQRRHSSDDASDEEMQQGEVRMAPETATKIRVLEAEIRRLEEENEIYVQETYAPQDYAQETYVHLTYAHEAYIQVTYAHWIYGQETYVHEICAHKT
ncbi:protein HEXIM2-like [Pollicipes pollicipes]|uniref:protein HEXIM2-like n=1 Tax=Pollicipes pollicipes TaxID=41117 RepID=UPI0018855E2B|nr:protein HEXIM2-like [Pollicipes pollicipes]